VEQLRHGNINWIPAHWVTTVYKEFLGSKKPVDLDDALLLLSCFDVRLAEETPQNRVKMAEKAWQEMKAAGTPFDTRHYNALLNVYLANHHAFDPQDFLMILSEDGVAMDKESYQLFVRRYCQTGSMTDAMRILEFMKSKGEKVNRSLFHALVSGHILSNDNAGAESLRKIMKEAYHIQPVDFLAVIEAHARMGNMEKVLETFIEMKSQSLEPEVGQVLEVLSAYVDWCLANNKYPESSALDSFYDILREAIKMPGLQSILCQTVVKLQTGGFHDIAADILSALPGCKMGEQQFFKRAIRTLPFTDVLRYCETVGKAGESDPMTEYCLPEIGTLPFPLLQQVLMDAKESEYPVDTISNIVLSKFPVSITDEVDSEKLLFGIKTKRKTWGPTVEQATLLAIQLELPIVKDPIFWSTKAFLKNIPFDKFNANLLSAGTKHDEPKIAECKTAMIHGFLQNTLAGKRLDRLKIVAKLLRDEPDLQLPQIHKDVKISVLRRLQYKGGFSKALVSDAFYILERFGVLNREQIGIVLKHIVKRRNPDLKLVAYLIDLARAKGVLPRLDFIGDAVDLASNREVKTLLIGIMDEHKNDCPEISVLEKMTLEDLGKFSNVINVSNMLCRKASAVGNEELALKALSEARKFKPRCMVNVIDMYVNVLGDGFKALEYLEALMKVALSEEVELSTNTFLRLIEILLKNGRSLADLSFVDEIAQSKIKLVAPYGDHDCRVLSDHVTFISNLEEDKAAIDAHINCLITSNLGMSLTDYHVASVLKKEGAKEALALVKTYLNADHDAAKKSIPHEEELLDAIVNSEDVAILKEYLDLSYVVHGERNSFLYLAFALYKGGKIAQGRRILGVSGLRCEDGIVTSFCQKMLHEKRYEELETFCGDVCCIHGVDKSDLAFYKLRSLMAKGDNLKALEYYNNIHNESNFTNEKLKQQAAHLYDLVKIEYFDRSTVPKDFNAVTELGSTFDDNISEVLTNVRNGTEYPIEYYSHLLGSVLAENPSLLYELLIERPDASTLEQLDGENSSAHPYLALAYIRQNRLEDLVQKCRDADKPEEYLTILNLQLIRLKVDASDWISQIQELAEEKEARGLIANLVNYHFTLADVEAASELMKKIPEIEDFPLTYVNSFAVLESITKMEFPDKLKCSAYHRMIANGASMKVKYIVKDAVAKVDASGIDFYASKALRKRMKVSIGEDPFGAYKKKEAKGDEPVAQVEDVVEAKSKKAKAKKAKKKEAKGDEPLAQVEDVEEAKSKKAKAKKKEAKGDKPIVQVEDVVGIKNEDFQKEMEEDAAVAQVEDFVEAK